MIPVVDFQFLPDMGRMNGQWRSGAKTICSRARTAAAPDGQPTAPSSLPHNVEPFTWLRDVLQRMTDGHPASRLDELLPWNWQPISAKA
jgi:IS66 C-terminal element